MVAGMWRDWGEGKLAVGMVDGFWTRIIVKRQDLETGEVEAVLEADAKVGQVALKKWKLGPGQWNWP
jgi:hypothetical protein